eukprot:3053531-Rhodomonas_salina.4
MLSSTQPEGASVSTIRLTTACLSLSSLLPCQSVPASLSVCPWLAWVFRVLTAGSGCTKDQQLRTDSVTAACPLPVLVDMWRWKRLTQTSDLRQ